MPASAETSEPGSPTTAQDPFDILADIRADSPVAYVPSIAMWAVTGHDAIREVLGDPARFPFGGARIPSQHPSAESIAGYPESR